MSLDTGIKALLSADATVAGLVSGRIYPSELPEGCAWPAILYARPETMREPTMRTAGLPRAKLLVTCYAELPSGAKALADAARNVLEGFAGTADDTKVLGTLYVDSAEGWDYEKSTAGLYWRELTFTIFYRD